MPNGFAILASAYREVLNAAGAWPRDKEHIIRLSDPAEDAEVAAGNITAMLEEDGFAFFDRYSSLAECTRGLNDPMRTLIHPLCNGFRLRAYYGVAAAALTEPESVPRLTGEYFDYISHIAVGDPLMYNVAKDKAGIDAIKERLETVGRAVL